VPDIYYRHGEWTPFDMRTVFGDAAERERLFGMVHSVTADMVVRDANAYVDYLTGLPETKGTAVGTTGYCMGGRLSLIVAGNLGDRVAAAASFHGGGIANANDPDSPHRRAGAIKATVYVAGATDDASFTDEQRALLERALTDANVQHTIETYPAAHGFAVPDNPTYDEAAAERHWTALANLYGSTLTS
jgi:carboxymethylenebutenolidase